ncbi:PaaI family thioesterase [Actibacterium pelagium]|nr:PaaI family thioesterase [Actibacterium pelagium]
MQPVMTKDELTEFIAREMPQVKDDFVIDRIGPMEADVRMPVAYRHLRPGGTVSGPTMFTLADLGVYVAILAMIGPKALTVTTNATIDFMRKPEADADLLCKVKILKLGRALAVVDGLLYSEGNEAPVARVNMTYSIPPKG